jgi:hypothetical protein
MDNAHEFARVDVLISEQDFRVTPIVSGEAFWNWWGVMNTGTDKIGRGCVIGANAKVTRDISDQCVAVAVTVSVINYARRHGNKMGAGN